MLVCYGIVKEKDIQDLGQQDIQDNENRIRSRMYMMREQDIQNICLGWAECAGLLVSEWWARCGCAFVWGGSG